MYPVLSGVSMMSSTEKENDSKEETTEEETVDTTNLVNFTQKFLDSLP